MTFSPFALQQEIVGAGSRQGRGDTLDGILGQVGSAGLAAAFAVTLLAGFIKGAVGFAMPLVMISGLSLFLPPEVAVAALILPIVMSNLLQVAKFGAGTAVEATRSHLRYIVIVCVMIALSAQLLPLIPARAMYLVLGIPTVLLSAVQLLGLRFRIPPERRVLADWGIGAAAGMLGGLSGTWGPPTVLYLLALDTPKARQMVVQGVVYGLGSVVLLLAHLRSGVLNADTTPLSAVLLVPAFLGMLVGFRIGARLDQDVFRKATLAVLIVAGLNLVRRGLMG
jgi:uncharacterized membrane protein YfcA